MKEELCVQIRYAIGKYVCVMRLVIGHIGVSLHFGEWGFSLMIGMLNGLEVH